MLEINFKLEGQAEVARRLKGLDARAKNLKPAFVQTGSFLTDFFGGEVFDTRGAVIGESWKPTGNPWPTLERSGKMRRSFKAKPSSESVKVWNTVDYFKYHQSSRPRKRLPRRVMMKLDRQRKQRIVKFFQKLFEEELKRRKV